MLPTNKHGVIPGRERQRANPESITRSASEYGSRVPAFGRLRNDKRRER
jgi:hypothetical protein